MKLLAAIILAAGLLFGPGCASLRTPTNETLIYKSLVTVKAAVDGAIDAWADLEVRGQVSLGKSSKVWNAYEQFRLIWARVVPFAHANLNAPAPPELTAAANDVFGAIAEEPKP